MNILRKRKDKGFTIIEVVLVLAIAALIFAMVFIALPALQRSQRDSQRKNDLARMQDAITSYTSNNRGSLPVTSGKINSTFEKTYLESGGDTFVDPSGPSANQTATDYVLTVAPENPLTETFNTTGQNVIFYTIGAVCNPTDSTSTTSAGSRSIALQMTLEGGGVTCLNN